eukprot:6492736-Amphidinium_carterae.1
MRALHSCLSTKKDVCQTGRNLRVQLQIFFGTSQKAALTWLAAGRGHFFEWYILQGIQCGINAARAVIGSRRRVFLLMGAPGVHIQLLLPSLHVNFNFNVMYIWAYTFVLQDVKLTV